MSSRKTSATAHRTAIRKNSVSTAAAAGGGGTNRSTHALPSPKRHHIQPLPLEVLNSTAGSLTAAAVASNDAAAGGAASGRRRGSLPPVEPGVILPPTATAAPVHARVHSATHLKPLRTPRGSVVLLPASAANGNGNGTGRANHSTAHKQTAAAATTAAAPTATAVVAPPIASPASPPVPPPLSGPRSGESEPIPIYDYAASASSTLNSPVSVSRTSSIHDIKSPAAAAAAAATDESNAIWGELLLSRIRSRAGACTVFLELRALVVDAVTRAGKNEIKYEWFSPLILQLIAACELQSEIRPDTHAAVKAIFLSAVLDALRSYAVAWGWDFTAKWGEARTEWPHGCHVTLTRSRPPAPDALAVREFLTAIGERKLSEAAIVYPAAVRTSGFSVDSVSGERGRTPLQIAVETGDVRSVEWLLDACGANANARSPYFVFPNETDDSAALLLCAARVPDDAVSPIVDRLIFANANVTTHCIAHYTPRLVVQSALYTALKRYNRLLPLLTAYLCDLFLPPRLDSSPSSSAPQSPASLSASLSASIAFHNAGGRSPSANSPLSSLAASDAADSTADSRSASDVQFLLSTSSGGGSMVVTTQISFLPVDAIRHVMAYLYRCDDASAAERDSVMSACHGGWAALLMYGDLIVSKKFVPPSGVKPRQFSFARRPSQTTGHANHTANGAHGASTAAASASSDDSPSNASEADDVVRVDTAPVAPAAPVRANTTVRRPSVEPARTGFRPRQNSARSLAPATSADHASAEPRVSPRVHHSTNGLARATAAIGAAAAAATPAAPPSFQIVGVGRATINAQTGGSPPNSGRKTGASSHHTKSSIAAMVASAAGAGAAGMRRRSVDTDPNATPDPLTILP